MPEDIPSPTSSSSDSPLSGAGIANIAVGAVSALGNLFSQIGIGKRNREFSAQMYEKNKADTREFWNLQNQYNSPEAQMQRLKAAGLNPNLVYGNGVDARSTNLNAPSPQVQNQEAPQFNTQSLSNSLNTMYDLKMRDAQINLLHEQALTQSTVRDVNSATALLKQFESMSEKTKASLGQDTYQTAVDTIKATLEKLNTDIANTRSQTRLNQQNTILSEANTKSVVDENIRKWQMNELSLKQAAANIDNTLAGTAERRANLGLISSNITKINEEVINQRIQQKLGIIDVELGKLGLTRNANPINSILNSAFQSLSNDKKLAEKYIDSAISKLKNIH